MILLLSLLPFFRQLFVAVGVFWVVLVGAFLGLQTLFLLMQNLVELGVLSDFQRPRSMSAQAQLVPFQDFPLSVLHLRLQALNSSTTLKLVLDHLL